MMNDPFAEIGKLIYWQFIVEGCEESIYKLIINRVLSVALWNVHYWEDTVEYMDVGLGLDWVRKNECC